MPRGSKCRRVCSEPSYRVFSGSAQGEPVTLSVEELESLRLADLEEMEQDTAAERMAKNGPGPDHGQNDFNQRGKLCGQRLLLRRRPAALPPLPLCLVPRLRRRERT